VGRDAEVDAASAATASGVVIVTAEVATAGETPWLPAFEGQRPPFPKGHVLTLRHGAHSQRAVTPVAEMVAQLVVQVAPALSVPAYRFSVDLFSRAYAKVLLLEAELDRVGVTDDNGGPREELLKQSQAASRLAMQLLREMGLTRKVAAELQLDLAVAAQAAVGAARQAAVATPEVRQWLVDAGHLPAEPTP
jgi:hypothetical protein